MSLQSQVDAAPSGATVIVRPCVYRETVTITKPLTLVGNGEAEIRGSDIWTDWVPAGPYWVKGPVRDFVQTGVCQSARDCQSAQQVFVDGRPLRQVAAAPDEDEFSIDPRRTIVLGTDPRGHRVEVTTRPAWILVRSNDVVIDGLRMQHAGNPAQVGALMSDGASNVTVRNSVLGNAHGVNVQFLNGNGIELIGNDVHDAGQLGVSGYQVSQLLVRGNRIHDNNTAGFDTYWEAGGLKVSSSSDVTLDNNQVYANAGSGLWCDLNCVDVHYTSNHVHDNADSGIVFEISRGATIVDNAVWNNGFAAPEGWDCQISIANSSQVEVADNTVLATSTHGILVVSQNRTDAPSALRVRDVSVHDNVVVMNQMLGQVGRTALGWLQDWPGELFNPDANNRAENNKFWFSYDEGSWQRFAWGGAAGGQGSLADFAATPGGRDSVYLSDDERDTALASGGVAADL